MRPELPFPLNTLCSWNTPVGCETLFPSDFHKRIKDKREESTAFYRSGSSYCPGSSRGYRKKKYHYRGGKRGRNSKKWPVKSSKDYGKRSYKAKTKGKRSQNRDNDGELQVSKPDKCQSNAQFVRVPLTTGLSLESDVTSRLKNTPDNFMGGKLAQHIEEWEKLTSDRWVLDTIQGYEIPLESVPEQNFLPGPYRLNYDEQKALDAEIEKFIEMNIVEECTAFEADSFYGNLFTRPKNDGSYRVILDLSKLTPHIEKVKFKMDTVKDVILMMRPGCKFASIDFKHAFFGVKVAESCRKYLRFIWQGKHYQFTCLAQGLGPASRVFTKLLKPLFAHLRSLGLEISGYIDDSIALDDEDSITFDSNVEYAAMKMDSCGFTINVPKSVLPPHCSQEIDHLGFHFNSKNMTVQLTPKKMQRISESAADLLSRKCITVRDLSQFIGKLVATEPGFPHAPIYYKSMEIFKNEKLRACCGDFDAKLWLTDSIRQDIKWWQTNVFHVQRHVIVPSPSHFIESDASGKGWGRIFDNRHTARGQWGSDEQENHINVQELQAAQLMLQTYCNDMSDVHIRLKMDNTTAVACINKMSSTRPDLMELTKHVWLWAINRNITLSAEYLPGVYNTTADRESRTVDSLDTEWMLKELIYDQVCHKLGKPDIDLFASRLNCQMKHYMSWKPDPGACAVDAFVHPWNKYSFVYLFPPFSLIGRVLAKMRREEAHGILIAPLWPTQGFWPQALRMISAPPLLLPRRCLTMPQHPTMSHPMDKLQMVAMTISGKPGLAKAFRTRSAKYCQAHGQMGQMPSIGHISNSGITFVSQGALISFTPVSM